MKSLLLFAAHFMCLLVVCRSEVTTNQAAAAMADGLDMFAMAKAIPYLQNPDGAPFTIFIFTTLPVVKLIRWIIYHRRRES